MWLSRNAERDSCREKNSEYTEIQRTLVYSRNLIMSIPLNFNLNKNMKKLLPIVCVATFLSSHAQAASGLFIGVDGLETRSQNQVKNSSVLLGPQDDDIKRSDNAGYGANAGIRFDPAFFYVSAEGFYERLNVTTKGFNSNIIGTGRKIQIDDRYGAKANVGVTILPWLTPFLTYGVASVSYNTDVASRKTAPLYGVGLLFDIPQTNLSIKASYDVQKFDVPYQNAKSKTELGVAHLGLTYTFGLND